MYVKSLNNQLVFAIKFNLIHITPHTTKIFVVKNNKYIYVKICIIKYD